MKKMNHLSAGAMLFIGLTLPIYTFAQFDSSNNILPGIREPYSTLDKSRINSGLLYDRTLALSGIDNYNGNSNLTSSSDKWSQVYLEMFNSSFNPFPVSLKEIRQKCADYYDQGKNPLLILSYNYNRIKAGAIDSAYLDTSGIYYYDGLNRSASPYQDKLAFAFTPAFPSCADQSITFKLVQDLYFSNQGALPNEIKVDFDDGAGWRLLRFGDEVTVSYSTTALHQLKIQLKYPSGLQISGQAYAKKSDPLPTKLMKKGPLEFREMTPYQFNSKRNYIGKDISGIATVKFGYDEFHKLHECLMKPVIIVEGIDFGYPMKPGGCQFGKCGALGFIDFLTGQINHLIYGTTEPFHEIEKAPEFIKQLNELGYDIIYLDFADGATFMEDNAMLLVELIEEINKQKCTDEELIVIGASMGGQIARFALSYMEKRGISHCTRMYVSFDSPHKGANVPLGIQHYIKSMESASEEAEDAVYRILCRNASRQLLVNHFEEDQKDGPKTHWARTWWLSNLNNEGSYPSFCRKVTVSNGSGKGRTQSFSASAKLFEWYLGPFTFAEIWASPGASVGKSYNLLTRIKLPSQKEKLVKAHWKQMPAFDNAPGSTRNNTKGLDNVPVGSTTIHWSRQCFINTISSLDYNTQNIFLDVTGTGNILRQIPFDNYYLQEQNEPHMQITINGNPSAPGTGNADWVIREIMQNDDELPDNLSTLYNFGDEHVRYLSSVNIQKNALLQVNGNYPTWSGKGAVPQAGSMFNLYTTDCDPTVTIGPEGTFELGEKGPQNNKATVFFRRGSTLNILPKARLVVNNNSRLVIEEGSVLNFYPDAEIYLDGENAVLEISGKLMVKDGAVFTIRKDPVFRKGFIRFVRKDNSTLLIYTDGLNAEIDLSADRCDAKLMEIINCTVEPLHVSLNPAANFKQVYLYNGKIEYGTSGSFKCGSPADLHDLTLKGSGINGEQTALHTLGQVNLNIRSVRFEDLENGIKADQYIYGNSIHINDCRFENCRNGILNSSGSFSADECYFKNMHDYAINAFIDQSSEIKRCVFSSSEPMAGTGISLHCENYAELLLQNSSLNGFSEALNMWGDQPRAVLNCCKFSNNDFAINSDGILGELNLSRLYYIQGHNGGGCTFKDNNHSIRLRGKLYLQDGANNFYSSSTLAPHFIDADIQFNQAQLNGSTLNSSGNFFSPALQNTASFYDISYMQPLGLHRVPVVLGNPASLAMPNNCSDFSLMEYLCMGLGKKTKDSLNVQLNEILESETGIIEPPSEFSIYPNPARHAVTIKSPGAIESIELYDLTGRLIIQKYPSELMEVFELQLPASCHGLYFLHLKNERTSVKIPLMIIH